MKEKKDGFDFTSYLMGKKAGGSPAPTPTYQDKEITITTNGEQTITADTGYDALSSVEITTNVPQPSGTINITQNGETNVKNYETANVNVPQPSGKITITQNGTDIDVSSYASADVNVPAGADLSEYFYSNYTYKSNFRLAALIKRLPENMVLNFNNQSAIVFFTNSNLITLPNVMEILNTADITRMFEYSDELEEADLSNWVFPSQMKLMGYLFRFCPKLKKVNLSSLNTTYSASSAVEVMGMFYDDSLLEEVDLSSFNHKIKATDMFANCVSMKKIDFSSQDFSSTTITNYSTMFGTDATTGIPDNCLILVKDQSSKNWIETNFSRLTNVQIKSEYIANQGA